MVFKHVFLVRWVAVLVLFWLWPAVFVLADDLYLGPTLSSELTTAVRAEAEYPSAPGTVWRYDVSVETNEGLLLAQGVVRLEITDAVATPYGLMVLRACRFERVERFEVEGAREDDPWFGYGFFECHLLLRGRAVYLVPPEIWDGSALTRHTTVPGWLEGSDQVPEYVFPLEPEVRWCSPAREKRIQELREMITSDPHATGWRVWMGELQNSFQGAPRVEGLESVHTPYGVIEETAHIARHYMGGYHQVWFKSGMGPVKVCVARGGSTNRLMTARLRSFEPGE